MKNINRLISLLSAFVLIFFCSSCGQDENTKKQTTEFDDGSFIVQQNGPVYYHRLFDDYVLRSGDGFFYQELIKKDKDVPFTETSLGAPQGYYVKYFFDPEGYIAYYRIIQAQDTEADGGYSKNIGGEKRTVLSENAVLFDCEKNTETLFAAMNELYDYCESNNINIGAEYYAAGSGSVPASWAAESEGWKIEKTPWDYCTVKNGRYDVFSGEIDFCGVKENYLFFRLQITDDVDLIKGVNEGIEYDFDSPVDTKRKSLIDECNVYADKYILINTASDEISIFNSEEEFKAGLPFSEEDLKNYEIKI